MDEHRKLRALRHYESLKLQLGLSPAEEMLTVKSDRFVDQPYKLADVLPSVVLYYARYIVNQHRVRLDYKQ
jgi:hypothetical protein